MMSLLKFINFIACIYMLASGLPPVLTSFGIQLPNPVAAIPSMINMIIMLFAALALAFDGFGEEHLLKATSLGLSLVLVLYFGVLVLSILEISLFTLPDLIHGVMNYIFIGSGICLGLGIIAYDHAF